MATPKQNRSSLGMNFSKLKNQPTFFFHFKKRVAQARGSGRVHIKATVERGGEAIFGLYLFLKRKEEKKLEEYSKRLRYGYLSKFGYGFTHLLVRSPPNSLFDCV